MTKLYIKQKVFSIGEKYNIYDEFKNKRFYCEGSVFSWGSKLKLYNKDTNELMFVIRQKVRFSLYKRYEIYDGQQNLLATVQQKALFRPNLEIVLNESEQYTCKGDLFSYNFQILDNGILIGSVSKRILAWGDTYELSISDNFEPSFFVAIVITIDDCVHRENKG
ncbi:hypothetical protein ACTA71_002844 [Dictyostelium dimigraforme]